MKSGLGNSESVPEGIARINRELCEHARRIIGSDATRTDSMVFELRKSIKKLRAILRIVRPALDRKPCSKLDRLMREFGRELGGLRDSTVLIDTLASLLGRFKPYPRESAMLPVSEALHCRYQVALEDFTHNNDELSLTSGFNVIETRVLNLDLHRISRAKLLAGMQKTYRRCRTGLQKLHAEPSTENSHDLRRQVKYAWNQLRLIHKWEHGMFKPMVADLDRLGRLLGEDSDIALLVETLQRHPEICCTRIRTEFIIALAESRRTALLSASLRLADRIFAARPGYFGNWLEKGAGDYWV